MDVAVVVEDGTRDEVYGGTGDEVANVGDNVV